MNFELGIINFELGIKETGVKKLEVINLHSK